MAKNENAVMYAVEQVCNLYHVRYTREQSRSFNVQGAAGRWRPMFFGTWIDDKGVKHYQGKADFLLRPRIRFDNALVQTYISVPLWVECKDAGKRLKPSQEAFRTWVLANGDYHITVEQDVRPLIAWFDEHGVQRGFQPEALTSIVEPIDATALHSLPCKWCGLPRAQHIKPAFGCNPGSGTKGDWMGRVWTPKMVRKGRR